MIRMARWFPSMTNIFMAHGNILVLLPMTNVGNWIVRILNLALLVGVLYAVWLGIATKDVRIIIPTGLLAMICGVVAYVDIVDTIRNR